MSLFRSLFTGLGLGTALLGSAFAATNPHLTVQPQTRVVSKIDNADLARLPNTTPSIVSLAADNGRLPAATPFSHMLLVLKSSDEQELALRSLVDQQQDKSSPNYHQWMTPVTFGASFGVAASDLAKVTAWLQDQGFSIDAVSPGKRTIQFSGTSGQVETAFHTEMHRLTVNGVAHISNTVDLSVPTALSPVLAGIASLNDFRAKAHAVNPHPMVKGSDGQFYPIVPGTVATPDYTSTSSGSHYVAPADVATIYNAKPLLSGGTDGTGVTIGIIGQTTINLSNVETFRSMFRLPDNDPTIINVGPAPAIIADDIESDLDVEWAGAMATGAKVNFYTAAGGLVDGGVDTSALAAVDSNVADIISLSYGGCELSNGSAGTAYWNSLWEQAAAQGQTAFVSSGDSSATGCASSSAALANTATSGTYGVNALGSSAYNVAVGGSEFNEGTALGVTSYWGVGGTAPYGTAQSYIPETVWSEGVFDIVAPGTGIAGGGGGVSIFTGRPSWQVGPGITAADPAGPTFTATGAIPATQLHRLVPDLSLIAAGGHDGTIFCSEGVCKLDSSGNVASIGVVGGTSVATPVMAGVQALINQKNGGRQGNANYYYYKLAAAQTTANCASTLPPAATCNFNDIVTGDNFSPKTSVAKYNASTGTISGVLGTDYIGFTANTGYDEATGLGTPNITNLANNWKTVTFTATTTKLTLTPLTANHGTTQTAVITVAPTSATGTPTGDVSITAVGQAPGTGNGNVYTLSGGTVTAALTTLPGGTYSVTAHYAGDSVFGSSDSAPVTVTVAPEASQIFYQPYNLTTAGALNVATSFAYGTSIFIDTEVQGTSINGYTKNSVPNTGAPTGTILYNVSSGTTTLPSYTSSLDAYGITYLEAAQSFPNFLITANYPVLAPGAYTIKATYSGDQSFNTSNVSTAITVVKATVAPVVRAGTAEVLPAQTALLNVTIAASGGGVLPTGSVTLTDTVVSGTTTTSTTLGTVTLANGAAVLSTNALILPGAHSITAAYGGDANYAAASSAAVTVTVGGALSATTLAATVGGSAAATAPVLTSVVLTATPPATATGTVYFYDGSLVLGSATISTTTHLATLTIATLTAGTHSITATYAGNGTLAASTSLPMTFVTTQNKPTLSLTSQQANNAQSMASMNAVLTLVPAITSTAGANPAPSATVQFLDGTTVLGTAPLTYTLNYHFYTAASTFGPFKPGPHALTAVFPGDTNYAAATSGIQNISIGLTTITVTPSATNVGTGTPLTLTAKITPIVASSTAVGGSVTFFDGTTAIGTAPVTGGVATLTTATLSTVATHTITAVYSGDANFYTSTTSAGVNIVAVTPGFTISVNPASLTVKRGTPGTVTLTATSFGNYNGAIALSCQNLPLDTFCSFVNDRNNFV